MPLQKREVILTQICLLTHRESDLVSQAMRHIPRILEVLDMEPTSPEELYNLILELQVSKTEIAFKTFINYLSERKKNFRFFPIGGFWTARKSKEAHLVLHLRGNFEPDDSENIYKSEVGHLLVGPFTYILTSKNPTVDELESVGVLKFISEMFPKTEQEEICKFLLRDLDQES
jgi:hypothetical protein